MKELRQKIVLGKRTSHQGLFFKGLGSNVSMLFIWWEKEGQVSLSRQCSDKYRFYHRKYKCFRKDIYHLLSLGFQINVLIKMQKIRISRGMRDCWFSSIFNWEEGLVEEYRNHQQLCLNEICSSFILVNQLIIELFRTLSKFTLFHYPN